MVCISAKNHTFNKVIKNYPHTQEDSSFVEKKKKLTRFFSIGLLLLLPWVIFAQKKNSDDTPQKFALVIGNGAYKNLSRLTNPVNDANDIAAVLKNLGFTVDKILNGNLHQMESGIMRLKDRLGKTSNSYGFFFYAGHGVQAGGENFLIPIDADIPSENYLRNRAVSVQTVLDELNDAENGLNVVVLDACRDNPFGWSRSGSRGLAIVSRQPADSIIVYATSAGQQASDGSGRNGLFTSQLLTNLATPGLEVKEVFNRTGADVSEVSGRQQIPAVYNQFFGTAYLGELPVIIDGIPQPGQIPSSAKIRNPACFWSVGASVGTSFTNPWLANTLKGTIAPFNNSFLELGFELGLISGKPDIGYLSLYPFLHYAYFRPIAKKIAFYAGAGGGYMTAKVTYPLEELWINTFTASFIGGIIFFDRLDFAYSFRTNFKNANNKLSVGYTYRF